MEILSKMGDGGWTISALQGQGGSARRPWRSKIAEALRHRYPTRRSIWISGSRSSADAGRRVMAHVIHAFEPTVRLPEDEAELGGIYRTVLHGKRAILCSTTPATGRGGAAPAAGRVGADRDVAAVVPLPGLCAQSLDELEPADAIALLRRSAARLTLGEAAEIAGLCGVFRSPCVLRAARSPSGGSRAEGVTSNSS